MIQRSSRILHKLLRHQHWEVGIVTHPIQSFLDPDFVPDVQWMPGSQVGRFRADPFMLQADGRQIVLYEDYDYETRVGRISADEWIEGEFRPLAKDVMPPSCHLAYPFTLEHEGRALCIPETSLENEVSVWEFDFSTNRFRKTATLLSDLHAVDCTFFSHEGRWWMACTLRGERPDVELSLWYAEDLFGQWRPHRQNPVKNDATSSRPAGTPFVHNGELFRPAQDCSKRYGGAVTINRVVTLTPDRFAEEPARVIPPITGSPYSEGIHTISAAGPYTLVDGLRYAFLPSEVLHQLRIGISRVLSSGRSQRPPA